MTLLLLALASSTWYVDASAPSGGNGSAGAPFDTIQSAIDAPQVVDGDEVVVASGTYMESIQVHGRALTIRGDDPTDPPIVEAPSTGPETLAVDGAGTGPLVIQDFEIRSAGRCDVVDIDGGLVHFVGVSIVGRTGPCSFTCGDHSGPLVHGGADVWFQGCVIRGFTWRCGGQSSDQGAGLRVEDASVYMADSLISGNGGFEGQINGAGAYVAAEGSLTLERCQVVNNSGSYGSGVYSNSAAFYAVDSVLSGNGDSYSATGGGGVHGTGHLLRCEISDNNAQTGGGVSGAFLLEDCLIERNRGADGASIAPAVFGAGIALTTLVRCTVRENVGATDLVGAAVFRSTVQDCLLEDNRHLSPQESYGGAVDDCYCVGTVFHGNVSQSGFSTGLPSRGGAAYNSTLVDCMLIGNEAVSEGSSLGGAASGCTLERCVVVGNTAGGALALHDCSVDRCVVVDHATTIGASALLDCTVANSIVWDNGPVPFDGCAVDWSCVDVGPSLATAIGTGNFVADPQFWSAVGGDYRLQPGSPCINTGDPTRQDPDATRLDVGAFPFDGTYVAPPARYCAPKVDVLGCEPFIGVTATPSLTGAPVELSAVDVAGAQFGLFFLGTESNSAAHLGGTLCVGGSLERSDVVAATGSFGSCGGTLSVTVDPAEWPSMGFTAGDSVFVQAFYRAAPGPLPDGLGLSDAVQFVLQP